MKTERGTCVIKVVRGLDPRGTAVPSLIYARNGRRQRRQYLSPEVERKLGNDLFGYFEGEFVGDIWWIGQRLPNGDRRW